MKYSIIYGIKAFEHNDLPTEAHYAALLFYTEEKSDWDPYSKDGSPYRYTAKISEYYYFKSKEEWEKEIKQYHSVGYDNKVIFFHSSGTAKIEIKVSVDIKES